MWVTWLGALAAIWGVVFTLTVYAQIYKVYKAKAAKEMSLSFVLASLVLFTIWGSYGLTKGLAVDCAERDSRAGCASAGGVTASLSRQAERQARFLLDRE